MKWLVLLDFIVKVLTPNLTLLTVLRNFSKFIYQGIFLKTPKLLINLIIIDILGEALTHTCFFLSGNCLEHTGLDSPNVHFVSYDPVLVAIADCWGRTRPKLSYQCLLIVLLLFLLW